MNTETSEGEEQLFIGGHEIAIIHLVLAIFAIFLAWKCQNQINLIHLLVAFFCPYLYIPYALLINCPLIDNLPKFLRS